MSSIYNLLNKTYYDQNIHTVDKDLLLSFDKSDLDLYKLFILLQDENYLEKNIQNIQQYLNDSETIQTYLTNSTDSTDSTNSTHLEILNEIKNHLEDTIRSQVSSVSEDSILDLEKKVKEQEYKLSMVASVNANNKITVRHRFIRMILWCIYLLILVTGSVVLYVVDIGNDNLKANILAAVGTVVMLINVITYIMTVFGSKKIETFTTFDDDLATLKSFLLLMRIKDDHVDDLNDKSKQYNNNTHINARKYMIGDYNANLLNQQIRIIKLCINLVSILIVLFALKIKISINSTLFNGIVSILIGFFIVYIMLLKKDNMMRYRYNWNKRYWNPPNKNI